MVIEPSDCGPETPWVIADYEYVGFRFAIFLDADRRPVTAVAAGGQHRAAYKDKHRRAALECCAADLKDMK